VIGPGTALWLLERMVYTGIDLLARCVPDPDDEGGRSDDSLLDRMLDAPA
jgi:hypothetical protein